ncbi:hypothetical protein HAX54_047708 [Datura stramonium]|uniref:Uncharacterized protein n=1 Tax=Datura stramonium TaxID=4076 RepID=A0ABS8SSS4_DATST|nr:hypothetical protein [Datura stramonium]
MGCFHSTATKQFPGHEDPVVLASQTACADPFCVYGGYYEFNLSMFRRHVEQCGGIAKSSGKVCKRGRLVCHGMTWALSGHHSGIAAGRCGWATRQGVAKDLARRASSWRQIWAREAVGACTCWHACRPTPGTGSWAVSLCNRFLAPFLVVALAFEIQISLSRWGCHLHVCRHLCHVCFWYVEAVTSVGRPLVVNGQGWHVSINDSLCFRRIWGRKGRRAVRPK